MKTILKDLFTQRDNETWSIMRLVVLLPGSGVFNSAMVYLTLENRVTAWQLGAAYMLYFIACGVCCYFTRFLEDGTIGRVVSSISEKLSK